MSAIGFQLTEEKYLFTFQDETKLWISKEFMEKYPQFPFYNIIERTDKYEDGSYYIDILPFHLEKVISFLMKDNIDIFSLNLKDSYDIYEILVEYSVKIDSEKQSDLLFHIRELFYNYWKENKCIIYGYYNNNHPSNLPLEIFSSYKTKIRLFTPQWKDEFLYYSLLFKMMNITEVEIIYEYSSNIPLEYICPSYIKDIFPALKELKIAVTTKYKKSEQLLNPNSDEYKMEYIRLFGRCYYEIENPEKYEYYTESDMNEYNQISSLDLNHISYPPEFIDSYNGKRRKCEYPKLYKYIVNEAIYTNDYSNVEISEIEDEYTCIDEVTIKYNDETNDKIFCIGRVSSKIGISQLLRLPSYLSISQIMAETSNYSKYEAITILKLLEEGVFDSITILSIIWIQHWTREIDDNLFNKIMETHIFPNVTELIYKFDRYYFELSSIKKENFPKLHIIDNTAEINIHQFESHFPLSLLSIIDTIKINTIDSKQKQEIASFLETLATSHSIHIDGIVDTSDSVNIKKLDYFENYKQNIECLTIYFTNNEEDDMKNLLEQFLKRNILQHLNSFIVSFDDNMSIEHLKWISSVFKDNTIYSIHELSCYLSDLKNVTSSEYLTICENIMENIIPKASNVSLCSNMTFINRLIPKGWFHNTTQLYFNIDDIPDNNFCELYTTSNFPQLKSIKFGKKWDKKWWNDFMERIFEYINNNNFQLTSTIQLSNIIHHDDYIYDPNTSVFRCKHDIKTAVDTIMSTLSDVMNKFEIETLIECINENKTHNLRYLEIYIFSEQQLSKIINSIILGEIPKLKEVAFYPSNDISRYKINIFKQQLNDSSFIQENHVKYIFR
ncbi:hypothetical protein WA158_001781 [Blastocystis sp. Blastoise]